MIINKPASMSVREWIVKNLSLDLKISEKNIDKVVSHQFESALNATYKVNSVEFSGFGKFIFKNKAALGKLNKYNKVKAFYVKKLEEELSDRERKTYERKLDSVNDNINYLTYKLSILNENEN